MNTYTNQYGHHMNTYRRAIIGAKPLALAQASIVVSEFPLNRYESFRAEIIDRRGKAIVAISRWKTSSAGSKRTGVAFEFAAHRIAGMAKIISDLQRVLASLDVDGGCK
jgi:hypothetical protein